MLRESAESAQPTGVARKARGAVLATTLLLSGFGATVGLSGAAGAQIIDQDTNAPPAGGTIYQSGQVDNGANWCNDFLGTGSSADRRDDIAKWKATWEVSEDGGATYSPIADGETYTNGDMVRARFDAKKGNGANKSIFRSNHNGGVTATPTVKLTVKDASKPNPAPAGPVVEATGSASVDVVSQTPTKRQVKGFSVTAGPFVMDANSPDIADFDMLKLQVRSDQATAKKCQGDFAIGDVDTSFRLLRGAEQTCTRAPAAGFTDVPAANSPGARYFSYPVDWMKAEGITNGTAPGLFSPKQNVTRAQMVTFLFRDAKQPSGSDPHGFTDVPAGAYYAPAVDWATPTITNGTAPGIFSPKGVTTRAQMATFLWRDAGMPMGDPDSGFQDVPNGSYYEQAVNWLVAEGITKGTSPTVFSPDDSVDRGAMSTFLFRRSCGA